MQGGFNIQISISVRDQINKLEEKIYIIISIETKKNDKFNTHMIKIIRKLTIKGNPLI